MSEQTRKHYWLLIITEKGSLVRSFDIFSKHLNNNYNSELMKIIFLLYETWS